MTDYQKNKNLSRRTFLINTAKGLTGLAISGAGIPLILSSCSSKTTADNNISTESMVDLGPIEELQSGPYPMKINYDAKIQDGWAEIPMKGFVYVTKNDTGDLMIMSPVCTHLGCTVPIANDEWKQKGVTFLCPCHDGKYDGQGKNVGGPPPRPFDIFNPVIQDGRVFIQPLSPIKRDPS